MIGTWRKKLKKLIQVRKALDESIAEHSVARDEMNKAILKIQLKHDKDSIVLGGWQSTIVHGRSITLDEAGILRYYQKKGITPPTKEILDQHQLEEDIKNKVVPAKILKKYSNVVEHDPYIRISKPKKEDKNG